MRINLVTILALFERRDTGGVAFPYTDDPKLATHRPWRAYEAVVSASIDVTIAAVGYLL
jgi:hypothetical protein